MNHRGGGVGVRVAIPVWLSERFGGGKAKVYPVVESRTPFTSTVNRAGLGLPWSQGRQVFSYRLRKMLSGSVMALTVS